VASFSPSLWCALAHVPTPGLNDTVAGILHPFTTPAHILILLGIGVLLGQNFQSHFGRAYAAFALAAAAALLLTATNWVTGVPEPALLCIALAVGALVAIETRLSSLAAVVLFAAAATAVGLDSGVEPGGKRSVVNTLFGTWIGLSVGLGNIAYFTVLIVEKNRKWMNIGLRVSGSWIVAISLLALAFSIRKLKAM
jgi:urease accessory protein